MTARRANKVDGNHGLIADAFTALGCSVRSTAEIGNGFPDLAVAIDKTATFLVEIKDPNQPANKRLLNGPQKTFHREWKGATHVVETVEQAAQIVAFYRNGRKSS